MESMDTQTRVAARSRRYSDEQKKHAVRMVFALREELGSSSGTVVRVARQLGYGEESLRRWVAQAEVDTGSRVGVSTAGSRRSMSPAASDAGNDEQSRALRHRVSRALRHRVSQTRANSRGVLFANATGDSQMANTSAAARGAGRSVATRLIRKPPVTVLAACRPMLATGTAAHTTFMLHSTTRLLFLRVIQGQSRGGRSER